MRQRNTDRNGRVWTERQKQAVWNKSIGSMYSEGPDTCGAVVRRNRHGNTNSPYGWEIDHIIPVSKGGSDDPTNLQVLHWANNRAKGDTVGAWYCETGNKRVC